MLQQLLEIGKRFTLITCEGSDIRAGLRLSSDGGVRDTNDLALSGYRPHVALADSATAT